MRLLSAIIHSGTCIEILFSEPPDTVKPDQIQLDGVQVKNIRKENHSIFLDTEPIDLTQKINLYIQDLGSIAVRPDGILNGFDTSLSLGCLSDQNQFVFRVFAPNAHRVELCLFQDFESQESRTLEMGLCEPGIWEYRLDVHDPARFYGYKVHKHSDKQEPPVVADPYSKAIASVNHYLHPAKTVLRPPMDFDWEDDRWICPPLQDLIIYEAHVRDFTIHPDSGVPEQKRGSYPGFVSDSEGFGLNYLKALGINAVELMPVQEFANFEPEYRNPNRPVYNQWNPYSRNHWGYMTTGFFAPESCYTTGAVMDPDAVNGTDGRAVPELKTLVKTLHQHGIAVILDVVYNHVSQYDLNPLRFIDEDSYFRKDSAGNLTSESGCGNDLKTERPMTRKLIVESILYWMTEYHIDGFRFDLASLIDPQTLDEITVGAREINPDVILIAEPWGGPHYGQRPFSERGWGAWNDRFRNGIKGANPFDHHGFIFGRFHHGDQTDHIKSYLQGTPGDLFLKVGHSVNYLESHDDYTLGDFIRIALGRFTKEGRSPDNHDHPKLMDNELRIHRLAALMLLTSRGPVMIHAGQEFGRSKTIARTSVPDACAGQLDHNSYNKDNETNWLQYNHVRLNQSLLMYYQGLIAIRNRYSAFRDTSASLTFLISDHPFAIGYLIHHKQQTLLILINASPDSEVRFQIPEDRWDVLADDVSASPEPKQEIDATSILLKPRAGMVCVQLKKS